MAGQYHKHDRTNELVAVPMERFAVDGYPTCMAWAGTADNQPEKCVLLTIDKYGHNAKCKYTEEPLKRYSKNMGLNVLEPVAECPLWKIKTQGENND